MKISPITQEQFETLLIIQKNNPILTYQNTGYDCFDKSKMTEEDKQAFIQVESILKKSIVGFSSFQNFRLSKKESKIQLRFQYGYGDSNERSSFIGVGYILLEELLNGFND